MSSRKFVILFLTIINSFLQSYGQSVWTIQDCLNFVEHNHESLIAAKYNVDIAASNVTEAKLEFLPTVGFFGSHRYNFGFNIDPSTNSRVSQNIQQDYFQLSLNTSLFNLENFRRIQTLKYGENRSEANYKALKFDLESGVYLRFFQYQYDKALIPVVEKELSGAREQYNRLKTEYDIGQKSGADLYDLELNMQETQQRLLETKQAATLSKQLLLSQLNIQKDTLEFEFETEQLLPSLSSSELLEQLNNHPDYQSVYWQKKELESVQKELKATYWPTLGLNYSYDTFYSRILGENPTSNFTTQLQDNRSQFLGFNLNFTIFDGLKRKQRVKENELQISQIDHQLKQEYNNLWNQLNELNLAYNQAKNSFEHLASMNDLQQKSFNKNKLRFQEGLIDAQSYFSAENRFNTYQYNVLNQQYRTYFNYYMILLMFGG